MDIQRIRKIDQIILFIGIVSLSLEFYHFIFPFVIKMSEFMFDAVSEIEFFSDEMRVIISLVLMHISQYLSLFIFGLPISIIFNENKKLILVCIIFAVLHIIYAIIIEYEFSEPLKSTAVDLAGYLTVFFFYICSTYSGAALSRYFIRKKCRTNDENDGEEIIYETSGGKDESIKTENKEKGNIKARFKKSVKYIALFFVAATFASLIQYYLTDYGLSIRFRQTFSCLIGGLLLGILLNNSTVRYGALSGILYSIYVLGLYIPSELSDGVPLNVANKFFFTHLITAHAISSIIRMVLSFTVGTWFGGIIKKRIQKMINNMIAKEGRIKVENIKEKLKTAAKYIAVFAAAIIVAPIVDEYIDTYNIFRIGELFGGFLLGILLKNSRIRHGALCGFIYFLILLMMVVNIGLRAAAPAEELRKAFIFIFTTKELFKYLMTPVLFAMGTWLGIIVRKRMERNKETELANP